MNKSKGTKLIYIIIPIIIIASMLAVMIILIPIEKHSKELETYGDLAITAETDQIARYIIDNIDLYPEDMIQLYNDSSEEARENRLDFIYNYAFHGNDYTTMSFTEEELNSESVPALYMNDYRWCYEKIGGQYIRQQGCAAVSITMAYLYLTNNGDINPKIVADTAKNLGALDFWGGINSLSIKKVCEEIGLSCVEYNYDANSGGSGEADFQVIKDAIDNGYAVMGGMSGKTFGGHALIIRGYTDDSILINDPANPENTAKEWDFEELKPEMYYIWVLSYSE